VFKRAFEIIGKVAKRNRAAQLVLEASATRTPMKTFVKRKSYLRPEVTKLNSEQAILMLIGRAWAGDVGARDLLEIISGNQVSGQMTVHGSKLLLMDVYTH
jgi:hypothetical protein